MWCGCRGDGILCYGEEYHPRRRKLSLSCYDVHLRMFFPSLSLHFLRTDEYALFSLVISRASDLILPVIASIGSSALS